MAQNWKSSVEELAGPEPRPIVYVFNQGGDSLPGSSIKKPTNKKKYPSGVFQERELHGAFDGNN